MSLNSSIYSHSVLIVDDDNEALEEMVEALQGQGLNVHSANDGNNALKLAYVHHPDFILIDYQLPDITGLEVVQAIRCFLPNVQVIMISGVDRFNECATTINTSAIAVLEKPLSINRIGRFISNRLEPNSFAF